MSQDNTRSEYLRSTVMGAIHSIVEQSSEEMSEKRSVHKRMASNQLNSMEPAIDVFDQMVATKNEENS